METIMEALKARLERAALTLRDASQKLMHDNLFTVSKHEIAAIYDEMANAFTQLSEHLDATVKDIYAHIDNICLRLAALEYKTPPPTQPYNPTANIAPTVAVQSTHVTIEPPAPTQTEIEPTLRDTGFTDPPTLR